MKVANALSRHSLLENMAVPIALMRLVFSIIVRL